MECDVRLSFVRLLVAEHIVRNDESLPSLLKAL